MESCHVKESYESSGTAEKPIWSGVPKPRPLDPCGYSGLFPDLPLPTAAIYCTISTVGSRHVTCYLFCSLRLLFTAACT